MFVSLSIQWVEHTIYLRNHSRLTFRVMQETKLSKRISFLIGLQDHSLFLFFQPVIY